MVLALAGIALAVVLALLARGWSQLIGLGLIAIGYCLLFAL